MRSLHKIFSAIGHLIPSTATVVPEKKLFPLKTSYTNEANLQVLDDNVLSAAKLADSSATKSSGVVSSSQVPCS